MQRVTQIVPCQWPGLGILAQQIAHSGSAHPLDKQFLESVAHFVDDDEPLGGNAALTGIYQATLLIDCGASSRSASSRMR
jgi:hypothetical protein